MRKYLLLFSSLSLAACTITTATVIKSNEIYQGYPCGQNCSAFKKGFDQAQARGVRSLSECRGNSLEEETGCKAYLTEHNRTLPNFSDLTIK